MASNRILLINEEIQKELSSLLRTVKDPRVQDVMISITRVETTPDLRYTKVYVSFLQEDKANEAMKGLKSAAGYLRRQLGTNLRLRYAPEIVWSLDDSITYGAKMLELINNLPYGNHDDEECHICHEGYGHCSHGVFASAAFHTAKTAGFVLFVTLIINSAMFFVGEEELFAALPSIPVLSHLLAAIFGLIPNCAASVALTSLAASGIISSGEMLAGLFSGAGVGLAVLLRNKIEKGKKIRILAILVVAGTVFGLLADLIFPEILFW